jgi:hypothetical protein
MVNVNNPTGLKPAYTNGLKANPYVLAASITAKDGDTMYLGSDGKPVALAAGHSGTLPIVGAMAGPIRDKVTGVPKDTSAAGDIAMIYDDVNTIFEAQLP